MPPPPPASLGRGRGGAYPNTLQRPKPGPWHLRDPRTVAMATAPCLVLLGAALLLPGRTPRGVRNGLGGKSTPLGGNRGGAGRRCREQF